MNIIERKLNDVTFLDLEGAIALEDNAQFSLRPSIPSRPRLLASPAI
jgi:hypothetical protein